MADANPNTRNLSSASRSAHPFPALAALKAALQLWMTSRDEETRREAWDDMQRLKDAGLADERRMRQWLRTKRS